MSSPWGPLQALVGDWEGEAGADWAYSHGHGEPVMTPYRERASFIPFGPVVNGRQRLYGLDHRSTMWRGDDAAPFHFEVGYWLWDGATGEILKGFVVPRGVAVLAGGTAGPDVVELNVAAAKGHPTYSIGENRYLADRASSVSYQLTVRVHADGSWTYDEVTVIDLDALPEPFAHADRNTMHPV